MVLRKMNNSLLITTLVCFLTLMGCTPGTELLNRVPVNSVKVEVLDENENPIQGAQVEASNGRKVSTDEEGMATVRFGSLGVHNITVMADNHMPANFVVTMPTDRGKTVTRQLTGNVSFGDVSFGTANMYPLMFNYLFTSYGYGVELTDYKEGEHTKWKITTGEDEMFIEKAFLKKLDNGQQWWQIMMSRPGEDTPDYTAEVLFSENRGSIVRYREQVGDGEIQEKPVSEGWYNQPQKITPESANGALAEENVTLEVPAGTFQADLLDFGVAQGISLKMWRTEKTIPGDVVKYQTVNEEEIVYQSELVSFSDEAETKLNSY